MSAADDLRQFAQGLIAGTPVGEFADLLGAALDVVVLIEAAIKGSPAAALDAIAAAEKAADLAEDKKFPEKP